MLSHHVERTPSPLETIELIEGTDIRLTSVTEGLLQRRLRAAAFLLALGFGLFLIRRLFVGSPFGSFHVAVVVVLFAAFGFLVYCRQLSLRQLRGVELVVFGVPVVELAFHQYAHILSHVETREPALALAAVKSTTVYFFAIIVVYGMFIPNSWRRAMAAVFPMAAIPSLLVVVLRLLHPEVEELVPQIGMFAQESDDVLMLFLGAICAVLGTQIINSLRTEAFHAKKFGRYRLRRKIGSGGMGDVYLAEHRLLKRECAVKLIRPEKAGEPEALARFEREVRTTAHLSHPNTIDIYDYGTTEDGAFFYVMEFLPGMDLGELVDRFGPLPPERVIHLLRQVCGALTEAHDVGFIHRDIKPGNIFCTCRGGMYDVAKLLDFGLVRTNATKQDMRLTRPGSVAGSPLYMSPEQALNDAVTDARGDIYSLGAVAYYLLTGHAPFEGVTLAEVLLAHVRDQALPPSKLRGDVPRDLERVVVRCLAKDVEDRYSNVRDLEVALSQCAAADRWTWLHAAQWWQSSGWRESERALRNEATLDFVAV